MKQLIFGVLMLLSLCSFGKPREKFRIAVAGLTHTHVHWILNRAGDGDFELVGIAEPNKALAERYLKQHNLPMSLWFSSLDEMLSKTKPEGVAAFGSIYEHLEVVQKCAPRGIHVMVEKPLAVSLEHAREIQKLARQHQIQVITNYETTWYGSHRDMMAKLDNTGSIKRIVVHDGHQGPKEIGVNEEFLAWLTDPKLNGGGAVIDFGCYGANLITWLLQGERPSSVYAVIRHLKPDVYPHVDDDATILLTYANTQGIVQASWNWPFSRKDIEVYTSSAYGIADKNGSRVRLHENQPEAFTPPTALESPRHDPFILFEAVVHKKITLSSWEPSALENNMLVMEILDAALRSQKSGKAVSLAKP